MHSHAAMSALAEPRLSAADVRPLARRGVLSRCLDDLITLSEGATLGVPREMKVVIADKERLVVRKRRDGR
jgi:hypothetical protein